MRKFYSRIVPTDGWRISFVWEWVFLFVVLWSYGWFGVLTPHSPAVFMGITIPLVGFILFLIRSAYLTPHECNFTVSKDEGVAGLLLSLVLFLCARGELFAPLVQDHLYHAQSAQRHAEVIIQKFSYIIPAISGYPAQYVFWVVSLLFLIGWVVGIFFFKKLSFRYRVVALVSVLIVSRAAIWYVGGLSDPHPPLRLLPLWVSSSLFGMHAFAFRLPQFLALIGIGVVVYRFLKSTNQLFFAWFVALCAITTPVLWHTGILVEQSVWSALFVLLIFYKYIREIQKGTVDWFGLWSLVVLGVFMRQSALYILPPLLLLFAIEHRRNIFNIRYMWNCLFPLVVIIPFVIQSIMQGTPASYFAGEVPWVPVSASLIDRILIAIKEGVIASAWVNSVRLPALFLALLGMVGVFVWKRKIAVFVYVAFISGFVFFYSIRPLLWGMGRYQAEYVVPFAIVGLVLLMYYLLKKEMYAVVFALCTVLLMHNVFIFKNIERINIEKDDLIDMPVYSQTIQSQYVYNYPSVLRELKKQGKAGSEYIEGVTYGIWPQILSGFSLQEASSSAYIYNESLLPGVHKYTKAKTVIVTDVGSKKKYEIGSVLLKEGFVKTRIVQDIEIWQK